jgi:exodeoxyribonuclease-3
MSELLRDAGMANEAADELTERTSPSLRGGGMVDVYRALHPATTGDAYTWWSNRGQAYAKNVGWRLDYHLATPALANTARTAAIFKDIKFSDHAPLTIDYDVRL